MNFFVRFRSDNDDPGRQFRVIRAIYEIIEEVVMEKPELTGIEDDGRRTTLDFESGFHAVNLEYLEEDLVRYSRLYDVIVSDKQEDR